MPIFLTIFLLVCAFSLGAVMYAYLEGKLPGKQAMYDGALISVAAVVAMFCFNPA